MTSNSKSWMINFDLKYAQKLPNRRTPHNKHPLLLEEKQCEDDNVQMGEKS